MDVRSDFSSSLDLKYAKLPVKHWLVVKWALSLLRDMSKRVFVPAIFWLHAEHIGPRNVCLMWCWKSLLFELVLLLWRVGDKRCCGLLYALWVRVVLLYGLTIFVCEWPSFDAGRFWRGASVSVLDGSSFVMFGFMTWDVSWYAAAMVGLGFFWQFLNEIDLMIFDGVPDGNRCVMGWLVIAVCGKIMGLLVFV